MGKKQTWREKLVTRVLKVPLERAIRRQLAVVEDENTLLIGAHAMGDSDRDRLPYNRDEVIENCLDAWRYNPLARRIVELTSQYVVGGGFGINCKDMKVKEFIDDFWENRLNRMESRVIEMCDELTRSGNLFILLSTDVAGMTYIREIPANNVETIVSSENDVEQPIKFVLKEKDGEQAEVYKAYDVLNDGLDEKGKFEHVVIQYTVNKPAGAQWGEPDLTPILKWLSRYASWLEDRVRLNRFRNAFMYVVKARFVNEAARKARQTELAANPPTPGSILVTDESEEWSVISPKLEAKDASTDGLALKKLIAAGAGVPLHFLAEPESSTRSTAEASGGPTYRKFEQRQKYFIWLLKDLLRVVLERKNQIDSGIDKKAKYQVHASDITARDNVALAVAGSNVGNLFERLYDMGLIDKTEMLRIIYRFMNEAVDVKELLASGSGIDNRNGTDGVSKKDSEIKKTSIKINPESGDVTSAKVS